MPDNLSGARVFLTGGRGFLGQHLREVLTARGAVVLAPGRAELELADAAAVDRFFLEQKPDYVLHGAAIGGGIGWMRHNPATAYVGNILMNTVLIEASVKHKVRRFVGVSSACVYPKEAPQPLVESNIWNGEPEPTNGPYGHAKRMMLVHGAACHAQYGLDCGFVVPTNLYGPHDHFDLERSHVAAALVRRFEAARRENAPEVVCWGTGRATRDLLHARDAAHAAVRMLEVGGGPEPVNIGSGREETIAGIATAIAHAVGYQGQIRWDTSLPDGMPRKVLDSSRARERLGWEARISLEEGLAETVEWYRRFCL